MSGAPLAHAINLIFVLLSVALLATFVARLWGHRAGAIAGIAFASAASVPSLVGWVSANQDLLAIFFTLVAFHLRLSGRVVASAIAFAAALLSKETAAVLAPALILLDPIVGVKPGRARWAVVVFGAVLLGWFALHSGVHLLLAQRFAIEPKHYVGFSNLPLAEFHAKRYALALLNVPQGEIPPWKIAWLAAAFLVGVVSALGLARPARREEDQPRRAIGRGALLGILIAAPTLILPAAILSTWSDYLLCFPMVGAAILIGVLLRRLPAGIIVLLLSAFALLGVVARVTPNRYGDNVTEHEFFAASRAIRDVHEGFRKLHPTFPSGSQLVVSVAASGPLGIDGTMHDGQAPRIWYRDPSIRVVRPERREKPQDPEFLFRVDGRDVWEIDPDSETVKTSSGLADREEVRTVIRTFARGLSASGEAHRAARILRRLAASDPAPWDSYDLRLAAMGALGEGDPAGAAKFLSEAPPITHDFALYAMAKIFAEPTGRATLDSTAYAAFGISPRDPDALRYWMNMFYGSLIVPQAREFALRLRAVAPSDSESAYVLEHLPVHSETPFRR